MSEAYAKLDAFGIEAVCERVEDGASYAQIAQEIGVKRRSLTRWVAEDAARSARAREARASAAEYWDAKAEGVLQDAADWMELHKARELAQHYRWRASKIAPKEYGDAQDPNASAPSAPIGAINIKRAGSEL